MYRIRFAPISVKCFPMNGITTRLTRILHTYTDQPERLAASCALGTFLACGPFLGIQTLLAFLISLLLRLNPAPTIAMVCLVNNPITMIPIVIINYFVGLYFFTHVLAVDATAYEPAWLLKVTGYINAKLHAWSPNSTPIAATPYLVGGLIFGTACAVIMYPLILRFARKIANSPPATK